MSIARRTCNVSSFDVFAMKSQMAVPVLEKAARLAKGVRRGARALFDRRPDIEEPTAAELWREASPMLEKALAIYDRKERADTLQSSWVPGRTTKKSCQKDLETILDLLLAVLGTCGAAFRALRELRLRQLRPFQGVRLNDELQRLAERVAGRGASAGAA